MHKKDRQPTEEWAEDLNRHFTKEDIQMTNKYRKKYPTSLVMERCKLKP